MGWQGAPLCAPAKHLAGTPLGAPWYARGGPVASACPPWGPPLALPGQCFSGHGPMQKQRAALHLGAGANQQVLAVAGGRKGC